MSRQTLLAWSMVPAMLALLLIAIVIGKPARNAVATGFVLLITVSQLLGIRARLRGQVGLFFDNPALFLRWGLAQLVCWLLLFGLFERPSLPWLAGINLALLLGLGAAYIVTYREERRRGPAKPDMVTNFGLGLPPELERTYGRIMRGERVSPEERARLDGWLQRRRSLSDLLHRR